MSIQAKERAALAAAPAAATAAAAAARPRKKRSDIGVSKKTYNTRARKQEKDTQWAKGAGFLSKQRNKPDKRVVKVSNVEKWKTV